VLNRFSFGAVDEFTHGNFVEKILGRHIPAKGIKIFSLKLARKIRVGFASPPGKTQFAAEFKLMGTNAANHPLVKPAFYRQFRCVIRGESGIEYVQEFIPSQFQKYSDGFFGYVIASNYPRDSRKLWLRIERRERQDQGGPWSKVAEFELEHTARTAVQPWRAEPPNTVKRIAEFEMSLGQLTVVTQAFSPRDIWNHVVTAPFEVRKDGLLLTNWSATYTRVADASGNWDYNLAGHRSLDPRYVWKLEADFEQESDFQPDQLLTVNVPRQSSSATVNLEHIPVTISWDGNFLDADMPTNRTDLALKFVCVTDQQGRKTSGSGSGSWNQYRFRKGDFMVKLPDGTLSVGSFHPATVTFAIVPNVHATFYAQARLAN
jgi:hypothetical protein